MRNRSSTWLTSAGVVCGLICIGRKHNTCPAGISIFVYERAIGPAQPEASLSAISFALLAG